MFCGKTANKEINRVHKRALCILLRGCDAPLVDLLFKSEENIIHVQSLWMLMIEAYKSLKHQIPCFLLELFARKEINYNLRIKDFHKPPKA